MKRICVKILIGWNVECRGVRTTANNLGLIIQKLKQLKHLRKEKKKVWVESTMKM